MPQNPKAPCMNCEERHEGCHSDCEPYLAWAQKKKDANAKKFESWNTTSYAIDRYAKVQKIMERKGRK